MSFARDWNKGGFYGLHTAVTESAVAKSKSAISHSAISHSAKALVLRGAGVVICAAVFLASSLSAATVWYASPSGSGSSCTLAAPCSLATGLGKPAAGDTLYLKGGIYPGLFKADNSGSSSAPITIKSAPGEWAVLNSGGVSAQDGIGLAINGNYVTVRDLELTNTDLARYNSTAGSNPPNRRNSGIEVYGSGDKVINCYVHDASSGIFMWGGSGSEEAYGNIIQYIGWSAPDRGHGHGIYTHSEDPATKLYAEDFVGNSCDINVQAYGSSAAFADGITFRGNAFWEAGEMVGCSLNARNFLHGAGGGQKNPVWDADMTYAQPGTGTYSTFLGYGGSPCTNSIVTNNYFVGGNKSMELGGSNCVIQTMTGNMFAGQINGWNQSTWPNNTYLPNGQLPTANAIFVRPNAYEPGRANVTVFNWQHLSSVSVNLAGVLSPGQSFEIRNAKNYMGAPVLTGTYSGGSVTLPMTGYSAATPVGVSTPRSTLPEFGVYVVRTVGGGSSTPTPTPVATATPSPTRTPTGVIPSATPTPSAPTPTPGPGQNLILEAESGALVAPMASASDPLASSGQYIASSTADAGTATFTVPAIASGATHYLWQRILCASSASDSFYVSLDGEADATHVDDACEQAWSGSWQWRRVSDRALGLGVNWARPLSGGSHTVRFRGRDANTKLDEVALTTDPAWIPGSSPTATATPVPPSATPTITPTPTPTATPKTICVTVTPGP